MKFQLFSCIVSVETYFVLAEMTATVICRVAETETHRELQLNRFDFIAKHFRKCSVFYPMIYSERRTIRSILLRTVRYSTQSYRTKLKPLCF